MSDEQGPTQRPALTNLQRDRIDFARRDLEDAQVADLTQQDHASLILLVTRLCTRLDDTLALIGEVIERPPEHHL
ncbi:hypothetical protein [Streptomyces antibioticus]|uniref:Uncharacterized protein n=1 Tax=Streptomyces antibioticus TaxID=1890 RepID=A0AAE6YDQ0_STRAT|nr:hypothetical protein [Streptomyces antibioticus]OOQ47346.1 hypothetical protein AFM16_31915 [Streptomyces antibioticus]QIT47671.1 hypothetical protein HCX60_32480 [Streptomyces antibioticus]